MGFNLWQWLIFHYPLPIYSIRKICDFLINNFLEKLFGMDIVIFWSKMHVLIKTTSETKTALRAIHELLLVVILLAQVNELEMSIIWREWITQTWLMLLSKLLGTDHVTSATQRICTGFTIQNTLNLKTTSNRAATHITRLFRLKAAFYPEWCWDHSNEEEPSNALLATVCQFIIWHIYSYFDSFFFSCVCEGEFLLHPLKASCSFSLLFLLSSQDVCGEPLETAQTELKGRRTASVVCVCEREWKTEKECVGEIEREGGREENKRMKGKKKSTERVRAKMSSAELWRKIGQL